MRVFVPSYRVDWSTMRRAGDDFVARDVEVLLGQARACKAAADLFERAGRPVPAVCYAVSPGHAAALRALFRLAGRRAEAVDNVANETIRTAYEDLVEGRVDILICRRSIGGGAVIGGVRAVIIARPAPDITAWHRFLGRLPADVTIIDLAGNAAQWRWPEGWAPEIREQAAPEILHDPILERLASAPMRLVQQWAEGDRHRLELAAKARGYKTGWIEYSIKGWQDKQTKARLPRRRARSPPDAA